MNKNEKIQYIARLIPSGKVATYGQVADLAGLPNGARMVGRALAAAPEGSQIPWHRIINSQGNISLPKDSNAYREQMERLRSEGVIITNGKIKMSEYCWHPDSATLILSIPF
ncbi:MGMT family protein [Paraferrimonas haliotis]|uniref:MGMT family protein n=1 Tax=Paraferrimonas haliotis TaxID=2013866 RepID=UPI000BA916AD|nr:MGMT family protein [Paraferrimonas haliotis]